MPMTFTTRGVGEIIRSAEKQISAGNFQRALELLTSAHAIEPSNEYIAAILERITVMGHSGEAPAAAAPAPVRPPAGPQPAAGDIESQVKRLTADARGLYYRGAYQSAFDTLTRAYLLDPVSVDVLQAEALIVPAIERMRVQGAGAPTENGRPSASQVIREHLAAGPPQVPPLLPTSEPAAAKAGTGKAQGGFFARFRKGLPLG